MNVGYFNDAQKEYVITSPLLPKRPWYNFIWNDKFISDIDQFGFGLSLVRDKNDELREFTSKGDNRHVFIRDNITGESYSANRNYNDLPFTVHETHVGMGYTKIISEYNGLLFEMTMFIPLNSTMECWEVKLTNKTDKKKSLSVYPYAHFFSTITYYIGYVRGDYCDALNGVLVSEEGMNEPTDYIYEFLASEEKPVAFEAADRYFLGTYGNLTNPQGLKNEKLLNRGSCFDFDNGVVLQFDLTLEAGEEKVYRFGMGAANSVEDATRHKLLLNEETFKQNLEYQKQQADMYNDKISIFTGNEEIDRRVNIWLKRQLELGKTWTRLWFRGSRDMMQDISAFVAMDTEDSREKIVHSMQYINPDNHYDHSGVEPYAFTNMFLGPENEYRAGETVQHWVTGTCGWLFKGVVEYMLGIQADFDGLAIRPVLPDEWTDVKVHRVFRNATYEIEIKNLNKNGTVNISVDGNRISGDVLPDFNDGKVHNVNVEIV